MFLTLPFNILLLFGPLSSLIMTACYGRIIVFAQIVVIILMNFIIMKLIHFYPQEKIVSAFYQLRELGNKEANQTFLNAIFTSWISPCTVWANNSLKRTKFLLHSVIITVSINTCYTAALYVCVRVIGLTHLEQPPIFHCFAGPVSINESAYELVVNSSGPWIQTCEKTDACLPRIRLCSVAETSLEKMENIILPFVISCQLLSILAGGVLQWLGSYHRMFNIAMKLGIVSPRLLYFFFNDLLSNPNHDEGPFECILNLLNKSNEYREAVEASLETLKKLPSQAQKIQFFKNLSQSPAEIFPNPSVWNGRPPMHVAVLKAQYFKWTLLGMIGGRPDALNGLTQSSTNFIAEKISNATLQLDQLHYLTRWWIKRVFERFGQNALHSATKKADVRLMQILLENGYDSSTTHAGETPIELAIRNKHHESIRVLLEFRASLDFLKLIETDVEGFKIAIEYSGPEYNDLLGRTPSHYAAQSDKAACLKILIEKNADVSKEDKIGMTPLHMAAKFGGYDCMKLLLQNNADINARDKKGRTPLHLAAHAGSISCLKLLIEKGAMLLEKDNRNFTPLNYAFIKNSKECLKMLVTTPNYNGQTLLHQLVEANQTESIDLLIWLLQGVDLNVKDRDGKTPLHCAATSGQYSCMKLLIDHSADVDAMDEEGKKPLHYAIQADNSECTKLLLQHSCQVNTDDNQGMTPLHYAAKNGFSDCFELLEKNSVDTLREDHKGLPSGLHAEANNTD